MSDFNLLRELNQRPIAYYRLYKEVTGSLQGAVLLSQLMYWFNKKNKIYKKDDDFREELDLTDHEMRSAKSALKKLPFIKITREGIPAKTWYEIDWKTYENYMQTTVCRKSTNNNVETNNAKTTVCRKSTNCNVENLRTNTKTTTKTTKIFTKVNKHSANATHIKTIKRKFKNKINSAKKETTPPVSRKNKSTSPVSEEKPFRPKIVKNKTTYAPKQNPKSTSPAEDQDSFSPVKPIPKAKYNYTVQDLQLYIEFTNAGATNHREDTQAYFNTMNAIHELLNPRQRNPYCSSKNVPDDYKTKDWSTDEIMQVFRYYISIADKAHYKNAGQFIYCNGYGTKTWSPLVKFHIDMLKDTGTTLEGDEKSLMKGLRSSGITDLDAPAVKRVVKLLDLYTNGYRVNQQLNHLYFGNPIYLFLAHVKNNMRKVNFKPVYIQGENFMKQFISDATKDRSLIKGSNGYSSI